MSRWRKRLGVILLVALAGGGALELSGCRLLYARYAFDEHARFEEGRPTRVTRHLHSCHYFTGLTLQYVVAPAETGGWCRTLCRVSPPAAGAFRPIMQPGYAVATEPLCRS